MAAGAEGSSAADAAVPTRTHYSGLYVNVACLLCAVSLALLPSSNSLHIADGLARQDLPQVWSTMCLSIQSSGRSRSAQVCMLPFLYLLPFSDRSLYMPLFPAFCLRNCIHIDIDMFTHMHTCKSLRTCVLQDQGRLPSVQDFLTTPETFLVL